MIWITQFIHCDQCSAVLPLTSTLLNSRTPSNKLRNLAFRLGWRRLEKADKTLDLCPVCSTNAPEGRFVQRFVSTKGQSKVDRQVAFEEFVDGATLQQLAEKFNVTRERVRQILKPLVAANPKQRRRHCKVCNEFFEIKGTETVCSKCRIVKNKEQRINKCQCGNIKNKKASHCQTCAGKLNRLFDRNLVVSLYQEGYGGRVIAKTLHVNSAAIYSALRISQVERRPKFGRGHSNPAEPIEEAIKRLTKKIPDYNFVGDPNPENGS